ncbi:MAG: xanthine dehydrogenase small subunit, partial [Gammaproteobacteria bacterium]
RFILDGELVEIENIDPTRTVLQYLREDIGRVGSKEGCAEGDCGACTVVVGEVVDDRIQFRAVNACIQFIPTLDGKMLLTVESLRSAQGQLHPVQQSMVDYHGSQCGFCTPGFIMSMFALFKTDADPDRKAIDDALSGNLCRCTGYRPIIEATRHMTDYAAPADANPILFSPAKENATGASEQEQAMVKRLQKLQRKQGLQLEGSGRKYFAPVSTDELAELYVQHADACILAGGTDVGLWVTKQLRELPEVIYLGNVAQLNQCNETDAGIEIGAAVSLTDAFDKLSEQFPELAEMFRRFSSVPVRNAGTLVGNIANGSPIGDSMPALICIGARVKLRQGGKSREMGLEALYIGYQKNALQSGEFIKSVIIPKRDESMKLRCYKLCKRFDQDISAVCAAFALRLDGDQVASIDIAFGGMAAIPKRATQTEAMLSGKPWNEDTVQQAMKTLAQDFSPLSDMRASAAYRQQAAANLLYRFYLETRAQDALAAEAVNVFAVQA